MSKHSLLLLSIVSLIAATALSGCATNAPAAEAPAATSPESSDPAPTSPATPTDTTPIDDEHSTSTPAGEETSTSTEPATTEDDTSTSEPTPTEDETSTSTEPTTDTSDEDSESTPDPVYGGPAAVHLGSAGNFAILAKSGISTVPASAITGDIATSPIDATAITGFSLVMDSTNTFATSPQVTGKVYAADYTSPTPSMLTTAVSDMETAYTDAAGRSDPTATEVGAGEIGGLTLTPGLYKWGTSVLITTSVTLDAQNNADAVWIFQIAGDLIVANGMHVTLVGGAQASNIFWQVAGHADIGTGAHFEGNLLMQNEISLKTGATMNGRALAQTAVTLDASTITKP